MNSRWLPVVSLMTAMLLWSSAFIATKLAFRYYDPMVVIFGRMAVATLCFMLLYKHLGGYQYQRGDWKYLLLMALCEPCLYFIFETLALQQTSAAEAGMITALLPLLVALGAYWAFSERLQLRVWTGFALAISGALWLSLAADESTYAPNPLLGNLLEFCAMICAAGYTLCLKHLSQRYNCWLLTALQTFCGALFFLPSLALPSTVLPSSIEPMGILMIIYLGTAINIGAYGLYNLGVTRLPASQASAFINLIPVFTLLLAYAILKESLNHQQLAAAALVIGGVILSQWQPRRPQQQWVSG